MLFALRVHLPFILLSNRKAEVASACRLPLILSYGMKKEVTRVLEVIALTLDLLVLILAVVAGALTASGDLLALGLAALALMMAL
jgi:hypothetical protein